MCAPTPPKPDPLIGQAGTSDSIPAIIEGEQPIRLSNGEAVLNKEAVELVGEDFVHRINAGGLAMLKRGGREEMISGRWTRPRRFAM